jgi:hypothetical protein
VNAVRPTSRLARPGGNALFARSFQGRRSAFSPLLLAVVATGPFQNKRDGDSRSEPATDGFYVLFRGSAGKALQCANGVVLEGRNFPAATAANAPFLGLSSRFTGEATCALLLSKLELRARGLLAGRALGALLKPVSWVVVTEYQCAELDG